MKLLSFGPLMASAIPGSPAPGAANPEAALAAVNAAATARLDALITGGPEPVVTGSSAEPIPAPAAPAPQPGNEPAPATATPVTTPGNEPGAPAPAPGAAPESITLKVSELDPAARSFLARQGYNVDQALNEAMRNNSLVATLMKERRQGAWTAPQQPGSTAPAVIEPEIVPVTQLPEQAIDTAARSLLDNDRIARNIIEQGKALTDERVLIAGDPKLGTTGSLQRIQGEIAQLQAQLSLPEVQADSFKATDLNMKLIQKQQEVLAQRSRLGELRSDYDNLSRNYRNRYEAAKNHVLRQHQQAYDEYTQRIDYEDAFNSAAEELVQVWPGAVERAVKDFKIGTDQVQDFRNYAKTYLTAAPDDVPDIEGFVRDRAKEFSEMSVRAHRAQSQVYGALATDRAAAGNGTLAPAPGSLAPAAPAHNPTPSGDPLRDVQRNVELKWAALAAQR